MQRTYFRLFGVPRLQATGSFDIAGAFLLRTLGVQEDTLGKILVLGGTGARKAGACDCSKPFNLDPKSNFCKIIAQSVYKQPKRP